MTIASQRTEGGAVARTKSGEAGAGAPRAPAGRVPPHDLEVEKAVLSALLLDNHAIHSVLNEVKPDDFYHPSHQQLYQAMLALQDENEPVDLHTLSDYLNRQKKLDAIGGPVFLAEIADYEATAANVVHHARIVRDKSIKREPDPRRDRDRRGRLRAGRPRRPPARRRRVADLRDQPRARAASPSAACTTRCTTRSTTSSR